MLDTDTVSFWFRGDSRVGSVIDRLGTEQLCASAVTIAELRYGATRRGSTRLHGLIDDFTARVAVLPFDGACAIEFGRIGAELAQQGMPIGDIDTMIAAHAMTLNLTLVTNNLKHFNRVRGSTSRAGSNPSQLQRQLRHVVLVAIGVGPVPRLDVGLEAQLEIERSVRRMGRRRAGQALKISGLSIAVAAYA